MNNKKTLYLIASVIGGFLLMKLLKSSGMSFKKKLVDLAEAEWNKWNKPTKVKEGDPRTIKDLRNYYKIGTGLNWSDQKMISTAWSATFISYIMKMAGAGKNFLYSTLHSDYIQRAKKNKANGIKTFQAYKPNEIAITPGDLVCYPRQVGVTYETSGGYFAHCDIVTNIENNKATAIGGNVSNSVSKSVYSVDNNNKITDPKIHVVIKTLI
jgi:hypothetical protein